MALQQQVSETYQTAREVRLASRNGELTRPTGGMAPGYVQANLCILPKEYAADFQRYCALNPQPCPLLGTSEPGNPSLPTLGEDIDIRFDVPRYRVWENGELVSEVTDIESLWRDDLVVFALGCSHSFEDALLADGLPLRHVEQGMQVPYYPTNIETIPSGPFKGPMVVSMRPFNARDAIRAIQITSRFPSVHGAPVHLGDPKLIGIDDLDDVETGLPVKMLPDEIPLFWACGVTPASAITQAKPSFAITHAPGHMLVTDLLNSKLSVF
jgi:uncharacterized protein YcsI (UPF0317 family)